MGEFENYSFSNVDVVWGIIEFEGYDEGDDVVNVEHLNDQFTSRAGAKGDVARAQSSDNRCSITIKLLQTSSTNKLLKAIYRADKLAGTGVFPMTIVDKEADEVYYMNNAWITKFPAVVRGQGVNAMEWSFECDDFTPR